MPLAASQPASERCLHSRSRTRVLTSCSGPEAEACSALQHSELLQRVPQEVGLGAGLGEGAEHS